MKNLILIITSFLLSISAIAQETVNGSVILDDPENLPMYRVRIPLWCATLSGHNMSAYDLALGVDIQPVDAFMLNVDYTIGLLDQVFPESTAGVEFPQSGIIVPQTVMSSARLIDVAGTFFFKSKLTQKPMRIALKSSGNVTTVTDVPGQELTRIGIRAGFRGGSTWYHMGDMEVNYGDDLPNSASEGITDQSTMLRYSQLRLGIGISKTTNLWIDTEEYGRRSNTGTVMYYGDILIGMSSTVDDVYYLERGGLSSELDDANTYYYTPISIDDLNDKARMGFEIGLRQLPTSGWFGGFAALGSVNGLKGGPNVYFKMGAQISLGNRIRPPKN
jgi:hypothetical protein